MFSTIKFIDNSLSCLGRLSFSTSHSVYISARLSPPQPCIKAFISGELHILRTMLDQNINIPTTSSMGRLFDGVASILGIRQQISYEGQAAMELELTIAQLAEGIGNSTTDAVYTFELIQPSERTTKLPIVIDWVAIIREILTDLINQTSTPEISAKCHNTLVEIIIAVARRVNRK